MQKPLTQPEKNSHKRSMTLAFGFNQITPDTFYGSYAFPSRRLGAVDMSVEAQKQTGLRTLKQRCLRKWQSCAMVGIASRGCEGCSWSHEECKFRTLHMLTKRVCQLYISVTMPSQEKGC